MFLPKHSFKASPCSYSPINVFVQYSAYSISIYMSVSQWERKTALPGTLWYLLMSWAQLFQSVHTEYTLALCVWGNVPLLVLPSQSARTPVSSLYGPCRVVIRVKPFEAGLIASCMTVWWGVFPLRIDFIMSVTLSPTLGAIYLCHFFIIMLPSYS